MDKVLTVLGRTFIGAGILVFLFVGYQLWGTNIAEARHQNRLLDQAAEEFPAPPPIGSETETMTVNTTPAPPPAPQGAAVAVIRIPKINVEKAVVEGTGVGDLKKGPGHYLNTPLPGQPGNAAIAGHRTTYGAPFGGIGELVNGDVIEATTKQGTFRYKVTESKVVSPDEVSVLAPTGDNRLTLTTCHPKYSAAKRLIVVATLDNTPAPAPPPTTAVPKPAEEETTPTTAVNPAADLSGANLSGTSTDKLPAIMWGLATAIVAMMIWFVSTTRNRWLTYLVGAPIFLFFLFFFFENFSRLLPANA